MAYKKPNLKELANYFGVHRNTMKKFMLEYNNELPDIELDLNRLEDFIGFIDWMVLIKTPVSRKKK